MLGDFPLLLLKAISIHLYGILSNFALLLVLLPPIALVLLIMPYFIDSHGLRSYPGPFLAKFTDLWLAYKVWEGNRSPDIHALHKKYGPFMRIGPNHISMVSPGAISTIYSHTEPLQKSAFYDGLATFSVPDIFTTRDRATHTRKRRMVAHLFAPKTVRLFEGAVQRYVGQLASQWDNMCAKARAAEPQVVTGKNGAIEWTARGRRVWFDCMPWFNFLAFDTIGDLAFGAPFGMLLAGKDTARVVKSVKIAMESLNIAQDGSDRPNAAYAEEDIPAISAINTRSDFLMFLAYLPAWLRPIVMRLPIFDDGIAAAGKIASMAITTVLRRLAALSSGEGDKDKNYEDFLIRLLQGRHDDGNVMGPEELSSEAQVLLIAGSDTISNSTCATVYWVARNADVLTKLQAELDDALADLPGGCDGSNYVAPIDKIDGLSYLNAVVDEGLRVHSAVGANLPRTVGPGGITVLGQRFREGTVLSVPAYSAHRDERVWGLDCEVFRPERWIEADREKQEEMNKAFIPFSVGPRACVGRNLAKMQLLINIATIFRLYDVVLENPAQELEVFDNFVRKPLNCYVGVQRRDAGRM
ncbi:cytochrome P450 monooxygenase pc-bph [Obba rivulosa]|uniref:Cytochrome P450 monooxygenase pc-bph n=1 Tax=Obba rivulosa TaxID=1052685 RepID=A0A8E2B2U0_9APHY|nr:cytochrome P450 monooxygenase pc-bph [Obba rivulosa]